MIADSIQVQEALLVLKIVFLVLLYLFIWRIVRAASKDVRSTQESFILGPQQAAALRGTAEPARAGGATKGGLLTVLRSPVLDQGEEHEVDSMPLTIGRGRTNDLIIDGDEFASTRHARVEPRPDGVWVEDLGSTNGTYVNGAKLTRPRRLTPGDVLRVGETELRFDA